ncbi:hypothetical protein BCR34DRAFT_481821 [Clohesyomyces aquaticus]|uniref:BZIP domain-containing protein n=1 Tax=Clohesyomyces aquaticus TaxID=1231657 RepID=A0A1Y1ZS18_9PLEO|nr:hypothetical protein BCR34DRAFT_481821 [Clohesyomyces aquaticus]
MHDIPGQHLDWAHSTFMALNDPDQLSSPSPEAWAAEKWPTFHNTQQSLPPSAFTIPPSLLSEASVARYGQITPPDELSPVGSRPQVDFREGSVSVEELHNEVAWPVEQRIQALADYQPPSQQERAHEPSSRRRRTSKPAANEAQATIKPNPNPSQHDQANPQAPKRKRGRPKSQPQPSAIEAFTHDGFPIHVASARQTHLEKNRVAAHKCRQRKKEYIGSLESRAREFSAKNKALKEGVALLREEVLQLKNEVLRHAGCGFWAVDEYLARCAGDLVGMDTSSIIGSPSQSQAQSPTRSTLVPGDEEHEGSVASSTRQATADSHQDFDHFDQKMESP